MHIVKNQLKDDSNAIESFAGSRGVSAVMQAVIFAVPAMFLLIFSLHIFFTDSIVSAPYMVFAAVLILTLTVGAYKLKMKAAVWGIIIFTLALGLRLLCLKSWTLTPASDMLMNFEMSLALSNSPFSGWHEIFAANDYYYNVWSMHAPFVIYQALFMKLFGNHILVIQTVNVVFGSFSCLIAAALANAIWADKRAGIASGLLLAFNPTSLLMSAFLTNQHIATAFFLLAIYVLVSMPFRRPLLNTLVCAIALVVSQLMRPEMYITLIAAVCYMVYMLLSKLGDKKIFQRLKSFGMQILALIMVFFLILTIANGILSKAGLINESIFNSRLKYKLAVGLNQETEGRFLESDYPLAGDDEAIDELLAQRISGPVQTAVLMMKKLLFQFTSYNYWWLQAEKGGPVRTMIIDEIFDPFLQSYMMFILFLAFIGTLWTLKSHRKKSAFMYIIFIGFMISFALVEVQQRYNYLMIPIFTVWASKPALMFVQKISIRLK